MRLAAIMLLSAATSCQSVFGGFGMDNPDNCSLNGQLCTAPDEACNPSTKLCEPAIQLLSVTPARASNQGGETAILRGKNLTSALTVRFAGVDATVSGSMQGAAEDQLTVVIPPNVTLKGKVSIELVHPEGQKQQRDDLFSYYSKITFAETLIAGPNDARGVYGGDFNGDGHPDVALCDNGTDRLYFFPGVGDGTFAAPIITSLDITPQYCAAGDINGDGKQDILVSNQSSKQYQVSFGDGTGSYQKQPAFSAGDYVTEVALADLNHDGKADLIAADGSQILVQPGDGVGGFGTPTLYPVFSALSPPTLTMTDMNGDGQLDLLTSNGTDAFQALLFGDGQGGFVQPSTQIVLPKQPRRTLAADLNGDGFLDLLSAVSAGPQLTYSPGRSDGNFGIGQPITVQNPVSYMVASDLNGDGALDIAWVSNFSTKNFGTLIGLSDGTFVSPQVQNAGLGPSGIVVQDLNGDGKPDIVVPEHIAHQLRILLNTSI